MTWVGDNKGIGPWTFVKQLGKVGYINNPRWTSDPVHKDKHSPCGYWPVGSRATLEKIACGSVYGAGSNNSSQLGTGDSTPRLSFTKVRSGEFTQVIAGPEYTIALRGDGRLWCIGRNHKGQLGLGDIISRSVWTQVPSVWKYVACSSATHSTLAIKDDGTLWATGNNNYGQLGLGDRVERHIFTQVGTLNNWTQVCCGALYSIALNNNGNLFGTGYGNTGSLGLGYVPCIKEEFTYVIGSVSSVDCGYNTTIILEEGGSVWGTGSNSDGQLGLGDKTTRLSFTVIGSLGDDNKYICCGSEQTSYTGTTFVIKANETMMAAGSNLHNQMGLADTSDKTSFMQVPGSGWGSVSNSRHNTLAVKTDGTLWAVGENLCGGLGLGDQNPRAVFTQVGSGLWLYVSKGGTHSMAVAYDGEYIRKDIVTLQSEVEPVWPFTE